MNDFDYLLHREVKPGYEFDKLIPKTNCKATFLGKGTTDFSVDEMAVMVKKYYSQMSKVAEHFSNKPLQRTCNEIHKWCYDHFQYKADKAIQYLRSPSCSWLSRFDGIDCKSYSIVASCILTNLGIKHYIRRIKQPGFLPDLWTHVYIVVPKNQKNSKLKEGYYVIDGTVATLQESAYIQNSDLFMDMEHYGLNGAHPGMKGVMDKPLVAGVSLNDIKGLFSGSWNFSCIGGSLNMNHFNQTLANVAMAFDDMFYKANMSVRYGDDALLDNVNALFRISLQIKSHSELKAAGGWKSSCSRAAVNAYKDLGIYYHNIVYNGFQQWLRYYFDISTTTDSVPNNTFDIPISFDVLSDITQVQPLKVIKLTPKANTTEVKQFVVTEYISANHSQESFDLGQFLQGITSVVASFTNNNTGNNNDNPGNNVDPSTGVPYNQGNNVMKAGVGSGIAGFLIFSAGAAILFSEMKDKPAKPKEKTDDEPEPSTETTSKSKK
ncbi:hypothetical protein Q763_01490 [Flavobacterium beibuense F44-8]|uniref:Transglutaminase-like domain-containing protein n=1 Tax=Flavobacterium beibuense F44-8 TaxID=1406840 RepID=A0A0A2LYZ4_9FLAO|nr:hypothetical protein [Flavobacterium beibuense]KGO84443.1 hypothetical protein Q763_01490 [Flavobacterium beibuense F44-8]